MRADVRCWMLDVSKNARDDGRRVSVLKSYDEKFGPAGTNHPAVVSYSHPTSNIRHLLS